MDTELKLFDLQEIRKAVTVLFSDVKFGQGECIEVRSYNKEKKTTAVGWFDDPDIMAKWVAKAARDGVGEGYRFVHDSMYWTTNPVSDALLSRKQKNHLCVYSSASSDLDITRRCWFPIDIDPIRPADVSATAEERKLALDTLNDLAAKLEALGITDNMYVGGTSGNGYHLLLRIDLPNDDASRELLKDCLTALQEMVGTSRVEIDSRVFNAARIIKAYGTVARKGVNDDRRPWRMAKLTHVPDKVEVVPIELLKGLLSYAPKKDVRRAVTDRKQGPWTEESLVEYLNEGTQWDYKRRDGRKNTEVCQFVGRCVNNENHLDAAVILHHDGWWSYTCFHNSCSDFRHPQFREHWAEVCGAYKFPGATEQVTFRALDVESADEVEARWAKHQVAETDHSGELIPLYNRTDAGNAERLTWRYRDKFLFCPERGWYAWDDTRWVPDATSTLTHACIDTARKIAEELDRVMDRMHFVNDKARDEFVKAFHTFVAQSEGSARLNAMASIAEAFLPVQLSRFDVDLMAYNVANGTIDLRTGELYPYRRTDYITNISKVSYDAKADCPQWRSFLEDVTGSDPDLIRYLQRAIGYSLTGLTVEHCMFILWGSGRNGKSTFLEVVRHLMGTYGKAASMDSFLVKQNEGIPNDLAALSTARFVSATESDDGKRLAEGKIKQITGGDTVTARFLHKEFFEFRPQFKLWLATNHKPTIYGTDDGIWRRIRLIPFNVFIPDSKVDEKLTEKLIAEAPGILNWALKGLEDYRADGMMEPDIVKATTEDYRESQDWMRRFLDDTTEGCNHPSQSAKARDLYDAYKKWCEETGEFQLKEQKFAEGMKQRGLKSKRVRIGEKVSRVYPGVVLRRPGNSSGWDGIGLPVDSDAVLASLFPD